MKKGLMFLLVLMLALLMTACGEDEKEIVVDETFDNGGMSLETVKMLEDLRASGVPVVFANGDNAPTVIEEKEEKVIDMQYNPKEWPVNEWTKLLPSVPEYEKMSSVSSLDNRCVVTVTIEKEKAVSFAALFKKILVENVAETDLWDSGIYVCSGKDVNGNLLSVTCAEGSMIIDMVLNLNENNNAEDAE
ncbi:MAG: hypothetical protein MJ113_04345 [Lachnospiraceae bacterium]|nr:hypothetical protein [Lachnospiraceae bacterium]